MKAIRYSVARPWTAAWLGVILAQSACGGCRRPASDAAEVRVQMTVAPSPPQVGDSEAQVILTGADGQPLSRASVSLEGNMNHAGMKPSFATLHESEAGVYRGKLNLTMGGDWFVIVTATLADGRHLERKIDLPGVRPR